MSITLPLAARNSVNDFVAQINSIGSKGSKLSNSYVATLNTDGTVSVTLNGTVLYPRILWGQSKFGAITDNNPTGDTIMIMGSGAISPAVAGSPGAQGPTGCPMDAALFIINLNNN